MTTRKRISMTQCAMIALTAITLSLLGPLAANADSQTSSIPTIDISKVSEFSNKEGWTVHPQVRLQPVTVKLGQNIYKPTYYVRLANGKVIDLPPSESSKSASLAAGLSATDAAAAAEDTRYILESVLRLLQTKSSSSMAVINGDTAAIATLDVHWLNKNHLKVFDPLTELMSTSPEADSQRALDQGTKVSGESLTSQEKAQATRLRRFLTFMKDAIYTSTVAAFKNHLSSSKEIKQRVTESGIQVAFRGEIQIGIGPFNFVRNFPFMLSVGYNRERRTVVFRRGVRTEKMAGGTAMLMGGRVEFRRYRMNSEEAFAGDPRKDYAKIRGTSWYPPSIPILSPVADSAPGYQSEGLGFGFNLPNLFAPSTLVVDAAFAIMNTVNSFEETQRVYAIEIPEPADWMKRFHQHMENSSGVFGGGRGGRCSHLFESTLVNAR